MKPTDIRRRRVREIIDTRYNGNDAAFARAVGKAPASVARWFMTTANRRNIGEELAREIETSLGLPKLYLDSEEHAVEQPATPYTVTNDQHKLVLSLFDMLTAAQRDDFVQQIKAAVSSNEAIIREVGSRLSHPPDAYVGKFLPKAPQTGIRLDHEGGR